MNNNKDKINIIVAISAASSALFLYTAVAGQFVAVVQRALLLMFGLVIVFLERPLKPGWRWSVWIDTFLAVLSIAVCSYLVFSWKSIVFRAGEAMPWDWVLGIILVFLLFEAARRSIGLAMPIIATISLLYAFFGPYMPAIIAHRGFTPAQMLSTVFLTTEGIWGTALGVGANIIVYFLIFTAFLAVTGASNAFLELANSLVGKFRGGPAKMAVVSSAVFGTISGSAPANVAGTGSITIPLMKDTGYKPEFAGAVEAVASSGGQIMPPIMGAAAFIMADILGMPYVQVCIAAALPALLYYLSVFIMVDLEALKTGLEGLPADKVPNAKLVIKAWWPLLLPLILLMVLLLSQMTPSRAAFYSLVLLFVMSFLRKETRLYPARIIEALAEGAHDMAPITVVCGVAGIIIGVLGRTGLGTKLAEIIVTLSGGNLMITLLLTMIASLIMGMGLPTVACYILLALTLAPAISSLGVPLFAAHMFVFYFGIISAITPPVAVASFTAAGIAKADINKLSLMALKLGLPAFILPYMFVYGPELLMIPGENGLIRVTLGAIAGIFIMAFSVQGYFRGLLNMVQRVILFASSLLLIAPSLGTDIVGVILFAIVAVWHHFDLRKGRNAEAKTSA